jgi:CheY-like chemotaxis protein
MNNSDKKKRVLLVDDDAIYIFGLSRLLSMKKIADEVVSKTNGLEALEYLNTIGDEAELLPHVIFLDLNMPIMDGWEFLDEFVKLKKEVTEIIQIFVISSSIAQSDMIRVKEYPVVKEYLIKPVNLEKLTEIFA